MIKVCSNCSNIDVDRLEEEFDEVVIEDTCLGLCGTNEDKSIGYVAGTWVEADTEDEFFEEAKRLLP